MPVQVIQTEDEDVFIDFSIANQWAETNRDRVRRLAYGILRLSGLLFIISILSPFIILEKFTAPAQPTISVIMALSTIFYLGAVVQSIRTCVFVKEYMITTQKKAVIDILEVLNRENRLVKTAYCTMFVGMILDLLLVLSYMWQVVVNP